MGAKLLDVKATGRQFVDRYELMGEIASGGMATVFLARLTGVGGFQRMYAIKRLHPHLQHETGFVEMFLDEARLAAGIHHPNVVPILEVGASENAYYLVMEYIEGDTLARLLARAASKKTRLPVPQVLRIAMDTLSGLHAAHELRDDKGDLAGVVHRDVSPQNVLVGADGISRITDFGVARAASRLTATRVGQLKGKIAYMAPEQASGDDDLDRRADVFAAGIVFWEALAHRRLFKAKNEAATLSRVLHEPIPDLHEIAPHISRAVCDVVMKALARNRDERLSTCAAFADALEIAANESGELSNARGVRSYMDEVMGQDIQTHREAVRVWTHIADSQVASSPTHPLPSGVSSRIQGSDTITKSLAGDLGTGVSGLIDGDEITRVSTAKRSWLPLVLGGLLVLFAGSFLTYQLVRKGEENAPVAQSTVPPRREIQLPAPVLDGSENSLKADLVGKNSDSNERVAEELNKEPPSSDSSPAVDTSKEPKPRPPRRRRPTKKVTKSTKSGSSSASGGSSLPVKPTPKPKPKALPDALGTNPYR